MDPTQSTDQNTTNPNPETNTQPAVNPNVQARFDEMTAQQHELRRQLEAQALANQELMGQLAAISTKLVSSHQPSAPAVPPPPEGVDPNMVNYFAQTMGQQMAAQLTQFKQEISQMVGGVRQSQEQIEFQQVASQYSPVVQQEAAKLLASWKKSGLQGWRPEDAFIYAEGQLARQARLTQAKTRPNGTADDMTVASGGSTPPPTTRALPPPKSDAELAQMTLAQREAYWASRVGNSELTY